MAENKGWFIRMDEILHDHQWKQHTLYAATYLMKSIKDFLRDKWNISTS